MLWRCAVVGVKARLRPTVMALMQEPVINSILSGNRLHPGAGGAGYLLAQHGAYDYVRGAA